MSSDARDADNDAAVEAAWVDVLGAIYHKVKWHKIRARSTYDVFEHRIEYSRHERGIPEIIQKLCDKLSVQAPVYAVRRDLFLSRVQELRASEKTALRIVRTRGKLLTLLAAQRAQELRADDTGADIDDGDAGAAADGGQQTLAAPASAAASAAPAARPPHDTEQAAGARKSGARRAKTGGKAAAAPRRGRPAAARRARDGAAAAGEVKT